MSDSLVPLSLPASGSAADDGTRWVAQRCDPYADAIPEIPEALIQQTSEVYIEAFETITGQTFARPDAAEPVLERVRRNLDSYLAG